MDIESIAGLSRKSRGILYQLKQNLNKRKKSLRDHVCDTFGYEKNQFKKQQFFKLIKAYDNKLMLPELDQLFSELDESCNQIVFLYLLKRAFEDISERDNPLKPNEEAIQRAASRHTTRHKITDLVAVYKEVREVLIKSEDIIEIIHLFGMENGGFLTEGNIMDIFNNLDFKNEDHKALFLQSVFEGREKISIGQFLEKLDLQQSARRSTVQILEPPPSLRQLNQSQFIKDSKRDERRHSLQESVFLKGGIASDGNDYISLEDIPNTLKPFFNYGSEIQPIFAHIAQEHIENNLIFIDPDNPPYSLAFQWVHLAQKVGNYHLFQMAKSVIHRQKNRKGLGQLLQPKDIKQGNLGDCYFLSAVAGVVEKYPELVYRLFVLEKNPSHLYGVRLFIEGAWRTVLLDACFPINRFGGFCGAQPHHEEIWVMLLEKAWAKVYGSYDNIHSGYNDEGLNAVSGAPSIIVSSQQNEFLRRVEVQIRRGSIITCATSQYVSQMSKQQQDNMGIFQNHAYSLLNIYSGIETPNGVVTLLRVRNPWGRKQWQGRWSFSSNLWTKKLRQSLDYEQNPRDGSFFINKQDFQRYFEQINICRVNLAYKNSWVELDNDREEFRAVQLKVKQKGDYYFTIYQENPRRYSGKAYEKSKSWIFLIQERDGKRIAIGSNCKDKRDNTIEATLEPGNYIIAARVKWTLWQKHHFTLSSYGPERVMFKKMEKWDVHILSDFIESKAKLGFGKKSFYDNANILKRMLFSHEEGFGFVLINNQENAIFNLTIRFDNHKGLFILPPYSLPIQLQVLPGVEIIVKFLVDPSGYSYSLRENYRYEPLMS